MKVRFGPDEPSLRGASTVRCRRTPLHAPLPLDRNKASHRPFSRSKINKDGRWSAEIPATIAGAEELSMKPAAIGLFRRAVMEQPAEISCPERSAQPGASRPAGRESFPFLVERLGIRQVEIPRQAALDRWRNGG